MTDSIANRKEAIPVIRIPNQDQAKNTQEPDQTGIKGQATSEKWKSPALKIKEKMEAYSSSSSGGSSLQDRFLAGIMAQIIPPEDLVENQDGDEGKKESGTKDRRSREYVDRPNFSVGVMSGNFRRFNARVGVLFVVQNRIIYLFTWRRPTATMAFLAIYSLICLRPYLLPLVPLLGMLLYIMVPSFLIRHPAPENDPLVEPSFLGPPSAPPSRVKPAPEMSKDFFRNLRDLQNCMEDFSRMHDAANEYITPFTNFSDEGLSSMLFVALFGLCGLVMMGSAIVPWRVVALLTGWSMTISGHPEIQRILLSPENISLARQKAAQLQDWMRAWIESDIILDGPPERRQVEIFELQKFQPYDDSWEPWLFSPSPYDPLSPARIAGARAKGTQFFEEVQPPAGWVWKDKKWTMDHLSREWVEQRMITGVEIETEGERWVYDIPPEEIELLESPRTKAKKKDRATPKSGWEEGTGLETRGEWRRRRWVRLVERQTSTDG
ncbi:Hypothetical protein R9X50_00526900 [Acrodontium crateriforme]|uniref:TECPR1-like DysF domain-containing protein n=1 Tax=Acrodontium crateriforme TaxID=150365 RepID=A0AAQ3R5S5_9PEZI|nr:Hypothetical protein R9X50_00526900 [Acrodontium crateriforme]